MRRLLNITVMMVLFFGNIYSQSPEWEQYTSGNNITAVETNGDIVWVGTAGGLVKIDLSTDETTFYNRSNSGLPDNSIECMAIDSSKNIWIVLYDAGLAKFDGINWTIYNESNSNLPENYVSTIKVDNYGNIWIGIDGVGLLTLGLSGWENVLFLQHGIKDIEFADSDNIWVGTRDRGIDILQYDGTEWITHSIPVDPMFYSVQDIEIDNSGNIWIVTNGTLSKFDGENWFHYNDQNSGLPENGLLCLAIDESNNKWFGTDDAGLIKFDGTNWIIYNTDNSGISDNLVRTIAIDASNNKWIGTDYHGLSKFDGNQWEKINTSSSGLPDNSISCMAIDNDNNKWIGTWYGGLVKFDGENWTQYSKENSGLPDNQVNCISIDESNNKWIGYE